MDVILVSPSKNVRYEHQVLKDLFDAGLNTFHLHKPGFDKDEIARYLWRIPSNFHSRIVLHQAPLLALEFAVKGIHMDYPVVKNSFFRNLLVDFIKWRRKSLSFSTTFFSPGALLDNADFFDYAFLGPLFQKMQDQSQILKFEKESISQAIKMADFPVFAYGRINPNRLQTISGLGFSGIALRDAVWNSNNPVETFLSLSKSGEQSFTAINQVG